MIRGSLSFINVHFCEIRRNGGRESLNFQYTCSSMDNHSHQPSDTKCGDTHTHSAHGKHRSVQQPMIRRFAQAGTQFTCFTLHTITVRKELAGVIRSACSHGSSSRSLSLVFDVRWSDDGKRIRATRHV